VNHPHQLAGTVDHVVPLSKGGSDDDGNVRAAHATCNSRRGAGKFKPHEEAA
jgi:5-methylcytosine-specific restriction endonuclease McrA